MEPWQVVDLGLFFLTVGLGAYVLTKVDGVSSDRNRMWLRLQSIEFRIQAVEELQVDDPDEIPDMAKVLEGYKKSEDAIPLDKLLKVASKAVEIALEQCPENIRLTLQEASGYIEDALDGLDEPRKKVDEWNDAHGTGTAVKFQILNGTGIGVTASPAYVDDDGDAVVKVRPNIGFESVFPLHRVRSATP